MTSLKVAFKLRWKPFEEQSGELIESFRRHRENVEKEANLSHLIEAADTAAVVRANNSLLVASRRG